MNKILLVGLAILSHQAVSVEGANYFVSPEEVYLEGQNLGNPPFSPGGSMPAAQGHARVASAVKGSKVMEWETTVANITDMWNEIRYDSIPPNDGTLYQAFFFKPIRVNGVNIWPDADGSSEGMDKAVELVGPAYRWTINMGMRAQRGPAGKWSIFITNPNPGHFNPECEVYDSYWQNLNGYGRGLSEYNACQPNMANPFFAMDYDRWYAVVFKVVFKSDKTGEIGLWINGIKVMQFTEIQTCGASPCSHARLQTWGTYNQPGYNGPPHKRQLDALVVTDDMAYLQSNGYFADPQGSIAANPAPARPRGLALR